MQAAGGLGSLGGYVWKNVDLEVDAARREARATRRILSSASVGGLLALVVVCSGVRASAQGIRRAGAQVFSMNCASIYCHGAQGAAGNAPGVAGKELSFEQVTQIIEEGVENTSMGAWKPILSDTELAAVIDYVFGLQKVRLQRRAQLDPNRPWLKHVGRELFFDPNRITPCGACHEFDGLGLAVAEPFGSAPEVTADELRRLNSETVRLVGAGNQEPFVGVPAPSKAGLPRWYDLTGELPILRSFAEPPANTGPATGWSHEEAVESYSDDELDQVIEYLRQASTADSE